MLTLQWLHCYLLQQDLLKMFLIAAKKSKNVKNSWETAILLLTTFSGDIFSIQIPADLVTFTEEILNGKLQFFVLCNSFSKFLQENICVTFVRNGFRTSGPGLAY